MTSIDELRSRIPGPILTPNDAGFVEEVSGFNLAVNHSPDIVVGVTSTHDVAEAVRFAAEHGLPVRIQSTGHGTFQPIRGGMLLVTSRLDEVTIDAETRIATVGAGASWGSVQAAAATLGLSSIPGSSMTVGAVGYTLGGGLGPLARSHGVTSDHVRGFEVVTASGDLVLANQAEHSDLFWALRGGKSGLGVVTRMFIELLPLRAIYGGSLFFEEDQIESVLRGWIEWTKTAPAAVTTSIAILNLPDFDAVPEPIRGGRVLSLRFAYAGTPAEGARLAAPLRSLAPAVIDSLGDLPTAAIGLVHNDPDQPGPSWSRGMLLGPIDQKFATVLLSLVGAGTLAPLAATELRHLGGATRTDVPGGSAVGGRASDFTLTMAGVPNPALFETVLPEFSDAFVASIAPWVSAETTINFAGEPATAKAFESAWPAAIRNQLAAVRKLYDPAGLFTYGPRGD